MNVEYDKDLMRELISQKMNEAIRDYLKSKVSDNIRPDWDDDRIDIIGQNGNDGYHYLKVPKGPQGSFFPEDN